MRSGGRILIIFGLVLGMIAAAATLILLRNSSAAQAAGAAEETVALETVNVIVAYQTIEPWQPIPADAIGIREYPAPAPDGAILETGIQPSVADATSETPEGETADIEAAGESIPEEPISGVEYIVGKISNTRIYPGQVIVQSQLVDKELEEERLGLGGEASYIIPDGKVAVAIPIDSISSVAGALRSGDQVDIIATVTLETEEGAASSEAGSGAEGAATGGDQQPEITQLLLQRVQILRVGQWVVTEDGQEQTGGGVVTVIVDPQQALELKHIREKTRFEFILRSITDETEFVTEPVDDAYIIEQYNLLP
jgi:Flp pilus assembly protein CpaB